MTTFEITITIIAVLGVLLIGFMIYRFEVLMNNAIAFFIRTGKQLSSARADMYDDAGNHYLVEILNKLDNIEDNNEKLTDIVDKMHRNLCVEIADKMVDRAYPPTKTIKVKGKRCELTDEELMKRINEDNKGD